jgi:hypothetical protein
METLNWPEAVAIVALVVGMVTLAVCAGRNK